MVEVTINGEEISEQEASLLLAALSITLRVSNEGWHVAHNGEDIPHEEVKEGVESISEAIYGVDNIEVREENR